MDRGHGNVWVYGLGEGILEEAQVGPPEYAFVVRIELDVDYLLMMGSRYGDGGG